MTKFDVVIVGGGIAGSALAASLAPSGMSVLMLERQVDYRDKVRGEIMWMWGVTEVDRLGLTDTLLNAGGGYAKWFTRYDEDVDPAVADAGAIPLDQLVPGIPGALAVGHPQSCAALKALAEERGTQVRLGVGDVEVVAGPAPSVRYELDGNIHEVSCRLIVGADGRQSTVRRNLDMELSQISSKSYLGGMLVTTDGWPSDRAAVGVEGDIFYLMFPRPNGFVRLYISCDPGERTSGSDKAQRMLDAFHLKSVPHGDALANAEQAGPCAFYRGTDSWTNRPEAEGVVLIGDAAGWSDPILGQGLSVGMRDVRMVSEALLASDNWSSPTFDEYSIERAERMRRLRVSSMLSAELQSTFTPEARSRRAVYRDTVMTDPLMFAQAASVLTGPDTAPAEAFGQANIDRILKLS